MPGTPTISTAARDFSNLLSASIRIQMADKIPLLMENATKYASLLMKIGARKPVQNPTFYHMEEENLPYQVTWNGATESSAQTTLRTTSFTNGGVLRKGLMLFNAGNGVSAATQERFRVLTDPSGGNITASRNLAGGSLLLSTGDVCYVMSSADNTGGTTPLARHVEPVASTFNIQNSRHSFDITDIGATASNYGIQRRIRGQSKLMNHHKLAWELSLWMSYSGATTFGSDAFPTYMTKGIFQHVTSNISPVTNLIFSDIENSLAIPHKYHLNGGGWLAVCGATAYRVINSWGRDKIQTTPGGEQTFGYTTNSLITSYGMVELDLHPLFTGPFLSGLIVFIPKPITDFIQYRYLEGNGYNHTTKLYQNQQAPGSETFIDEVKTKAAFELWEEIKWGMITGVAA